MTPTDLKAWETRVIGRGADTHGNGTKAAEALGMPYKSYRNLLTGRTHAEAIPGPIARLCHYIERYGAL